MGICVSMTAMQQERKSVAARPKSTGNRDRTRARFFGPYLPAQSPQKCTVHCAYDDHNPMVFLLHAAKLLTTNAEEGGGGLSGGEAVDLTAA